MLANSEETSRTLETLLYLYETPIEQIMKDTKRTESLFQETMRGTELPFSIRDETEGPRLESSSSSEPKLIESFPLDEERDINPELVQRVMGEINAQTQEQAQAQAQEQAQASGVIDLVSDDDESDEAMWECPNCGNLNDPDFADCVICGTEKPTSESIVTSSTSLISESQRRYITYSIQNYNPEKYKTYYYTIKYYCKYKNNNTKYLVNIKKAQFEAYSRLILYQRTGNPPIKKIDNNNNYEFRTTFGGDSRNIPIFYDIILNIDLRKYEPSREESPLDLIYGVSIYKQLTSGRVAEISSQEDITIFCLDAGKNVIMINLELNGIKKSFVWTLEELKYKRLGMGGKKNINKKSKKNKTKKYKKQNKPKILKTKRYNNNKNNKRHTSQNVEKKRKQKNKKTIKYYY